MSSDSRWAHYILHLVPKRGDGRTHGLSKTRWTDSIVKIAGGHWLELAHDPALWALLVDAAHVRECSARPSLSASAMHHGPSHFITSHVKYICWGDIN